jgi:hypothetical protein
MRRRVAIAAWLGFALAALFFYPLAVALDSDRYYLQWQPQDLVETAAAWTVLALIFGAAVFALWPRSSRRATGALIAVALVPLLSFGGGFARQLPFDDALRTTWENPAIRLGIPALVAGGIAAALAWWPSVAAAWLRRMLFVISPVSIVVLLTFARSTTGTTPLLASDRGSERAATTQSTTCASVLALLFDELSFSYLYDETGQVRAEFPEIRRFASQATTYAHAIAPGNETLVALPSFLSARQLRDVRVEDTGLAYVEEGKLLPFTAVAEDGLFATARRLGFSTEVAGYYLPYCELLNGLVDACRSMSFYNVSTVHAGFSPVDPVLTTLVLWPRQFPLGLLKGPAFAVLQRQLVEQTMAFARRPLSPERPTFRLLHFSIPHLPFVFDGGGYNPPLDPMETSPDTAYAEQILYIDRLVGELLDEMRDAGTYDSTTIVLFADHGYRFGGRERDPLHIPFIVKRAEQREPMQVTTPTRGELLLKDVVQGSCRAG